MTQTPNLGMFKPNDEPMNLMLSLNKMVTPAKSQVKCQQNDDPSKDLGVSVIKMMITTQILE